MVFCHILIGSGVAHSKRAFQIPLGARTARGVPLPQVLPIGMSETVTSVIPVTSFSEPEPSAEVVAASVDGAPAVPMGASKQSGTHLVLMTTQGYIKRTPLKAFQSISNRGLTILSLGEGDKLKWARLCGSQDDILIATK